MRDVVVVETSEHVYDGVGLSDVSEEFVSEAFAFACAFDKSGDINYFARRGHYSSRVYDFREARKSFVRHSDDADVRFYGAEWEVRRLRLRA